MHHLSLNNRGTSLPLALMAVALLSLVLYAGLQIGDRLRQGSKQSSSKSESTSLSDYVSSLLSNPEVCLGTAAFTGLQVNGAHSVDLTPGLQQDIEIGTNLDSLSSSGGHTHALKPGSAPSEFSVTVDKFYLVPTTMSGQADVYLQVQTSDGLKLAPQKLGLLYLTTPGPLGVQPINGCQIKMQTQQACLQMGCAWMGAAASPECLCNRPSLDCTPGGANAYVQGYTVVSGSIVPLCKYADFNCPTGQFLKGFDSSGALICTSVTTVGP